MDNQLGLFRVLTDELWIFKWIQLINFGMIILSRFGLIIFLRFEGIELFNFDSFEWLIVWLIWFGLRF
jgi:hypothetical protein